MRCAAEEIPVPPQVLASEGGEGLQSRPPAALGPSAAVPSVIPAQSAEAPPAPAETPAAAAEAPATGETRARPAETPAAAGGTPAPAVVVTPTEETRMRVAAVLLGRVPQSIEEADRALTEQGFGHSPPRAG